MIRDKYIIEDSKGSQGAQVMRQIPALLTPFFECTSCNTLCEI